ncbi:tyrosine-type recombinase/integrase [Nocardia sp. NPDC056611]|uniref:tyrosine-type recombinase/integrase n=1 Tax=Nocardia sp. NPDC056611 TaxID=3345877 RepID=UPI0036728238
MPKQMLSNPPRGKRRTTANGDTRKRAVNGSISHYKDEKKGLHVFSMEHPQKTGPDGKRMPRLRAKNKDYNAGLAAIQGKFDRVKQGLPPTVSKITVGWWLDYWYEHILKVTAKPKTLEGFEIAIRLHITPHIGNVKLEELGPDHVRYMQEQIIEATGVPTARKARRVLNSAINAGVGERKELPFNRVANVPQPKALPSTKTPYTPREAAMLLRFVQDSEDFYASLWGFFLLTGDRKGEAIGLTWDCVDFVNDTIDMSWQLQRYTKKHGCEPLVIAPNGKVEAWTCERAYGAYCPQARFDFPDWYEVRELWGGLVLSRPKTEAGQRLIPMIAPLRELLARQAERTYDEPNNVHNLVWYNIRPRSMFRPVSPEFVDDLWASVHEQVGIPSRSLHEIRHTTVTLLMAFGVPIEIIKQIVGHSTVFSTENYLHVGVDLARKEFAKLNMLLSIDTSEPEVVVSAASGRRLPPGLSPQIRAIS